MNRDDVVRIAKQAGMSGMATTVVCEIAELERFAELVKADFLEKSGQYITNDASREAAIKEAVAAEREACAKVAENACLVDPDGGSPTEDERIVCEEAGRRIRLRGNQ